MQKHKTFNHFISYYMSTEALSITDSKKYDVELTVNSLNLNSKLWQSLRRKKAFTFSLEASWGSFGTADRGHCHHHLERGRGERLGGRAAPALLQDGVRG